MKATEKRQRREHFLAAHRASGLPVTTQRRAVFESILRRRDHPTAERLYQVVRARLPDVSRMTIHRILNTFVSLGLVAKTCHPGSAARFDPELGRHHHLVCLQCGRIIDVEDPSLDQLPWPKLNSNDFQIQTYQVHFHGRCAQCAQKPQTSRPKPPAKPIRRLGRKILS